LAVDDRPLKPNHIGTTDAVAKDAAKTLVFQGFHAGKLVSEAPDRENS
jgi:hypothetical protein